MNSVQEDLQVGAVDVEKKAVFIVRISVLGTG